MSQREELVQSILGKIITYDPNIKEIFKDVSILGTALGGYEGGDVMMIQTNPEAGTWEADVTLKPGSVKFRCEKRWDINWGGQFFPKGTAERNALNINVKEGNYHVVFNANSGEYSFTKINDQK